MIAPVLTDPRVEAAPAKVAATVALALVGAVPRGVLSR